MTVNADFASQQQRYTLARRWMRDFWLWLGFRLLVKVDVRGLEHIPPGGPTILMMNHSGALDPFVMLGAVRPRFVVPMSKIENFRIPVIGLLMRLWGAYPVRRAEVDRAALQNTVDLLKRGNLVLMAPEGTRQPALIEGKDGMTYVAIKADAVIVPVGLDGTREFMHNLKRLRRAPITMNFGPAFRFRTGGRERIPRDEMHHMTQEAMYQLAKLVPPARRGVYSDLSKATTETIEFVT
jgi:1-acyl-sn-glycerol-3-phosphate acyltransferase